jgi:hypothetical protein
MINYNGLSYVRVRLEGQELPDTVQLKVVSVRSHRALALPVFSLVIRDLKRELGDHIVEGARVELLVAQKKENNAEWMPFRIFSYTSTNVTNVGTVYEIHGYYDYKAYLYSRVSRRFSGPSSGIVQKLADEGGLKATIDTTTEADTDWYCSRQTLAHFVKNEVLPAASAGRDSLMASAIDARNGRWNYRNLAKVVTGKVESKMTNTSLVNPGEYDAMFMQHRYANTSGHNNVLGYSMKNVRYDATLGEARDDNEIDIVKTASRLSMSTDVPDSSYVYYPPLDFGNNGNGSQHRGQNLRQSSVWSMGMDILLSVYSPFDLLTLHHLDFVDDGSGADRRLSGDYVCVGRTVAATAVSYREALSFVRNSESVESDRVIS